MREAFFVLSGLNGCDLMPISRTSETAVEMGSGSNAGSCIERIPLWRRNSPATTLSCDTNLAISGIRSNHVAFAPRQSTSDQWQGCAYQHDASDNVERRCVVRIFRGTEACNQYRTNNTACTPRGEHGTVNCSRIFRPEEVGGEGRHGAKATAVTQCDDGYRNEEHNKAGNRRQDGKDDG